MRLEKSLEHLDEEYHKTILTLCGLLAETSFQIDNYEGSADENQAKDFFFRKELGELQELVSRAYERTASILGKLLLWDCIGNEVDIVINLRIEDEKIP